MKRPQDPKFRAELLKKLREYRGHLDYARQQLNEKQYQRARTKLTDCYREVKGKIIELEPGYLEAQNAWKPIFMEMMADYRVFCAERNLNWPAKVEEAVRTEFPDTYIDKLPLTENLKRLGLESLLTLNPHATPSSPRKRIGKQSPIGSAQ